MGQHDGHGLEAHANTLRLHWLGLRDGHGLGTQLTERLSMSHMDDVIDMEMSTFETVGMPDR